MHTGINVGALLLGLPTHRQPAAPPPRPILTAEDVVKRIAAECAFIDAREIVQRLRAITPLIMPDALHWRNPECRELFLSGLRLAAGEAT
jgi:hypothetical protein